MRDIVRRLKENGVSTATSDWQITRLLQLGKARKDIVKYIQDALKLSDEEVSNIFLDKAYEEYNEHARAYELSNMQQVPFDENIILQELIEAVKEQLQLEFKNLTASMGFAIKDPSTGKVISSPLLDFYRNTMDQAVLTGFRQVQGKINEQVARELKTDKYEVSYHVGARPDHQPWQGKVWTLQELIDVCGLGTDPGLLGWNCYHDYKPFPLGSVRTYTDEQLSELLKAENTPKEYNRKQYTTYEALQVQRKMERNMRAQRQKIKLLQEGGADEQDIILAKAKYQGQMQTYKDFSQKMGLPQQKARIMQDGLKGQFMPTKTELSKMEKAVEIKKKSDIIGIQPLY